MSKTSLIARIRPSFLNWARGMLVSPSLLHVIDAGSASPLTSHVSIARSPTATMVLSGRSLIKGLAKRVECLS